jgi:hypothetical protein
MGAEPAGCDAPGPGTGPALPGVPAARPATIRTAAKLNQHDEVVTAALADILRQQPWARRFPAPELAKFLLAAREGVLARTVRDDESAADTVQAVTSVVSAAFDP